MTLCPHCGQPWPETPILLNVGAATLAEAFAQFWQSYPHKVGKVAAAKAWPRACQRARGLAAIIEGLERYKRNKPANYAWCNPTTWLNQARWEDEPAYVDTTLKPEPPKQDGFEIWRVRIRNYLKDGSWPQIAPPLEQCPWQVRAEFEEQLKAR